MSDQLERDFDQLRDDSGLIELNDVAFVELVGEDRKGWLQGQVTNNVRKFDAGNSIGFCFTESTGHLVSVLHGWALQDRIFLSCPASTLAAVLARVEQMVVMEDVKALDAGGEYRYFSIQGPAASRKLGKRMHLPSLDAGESRWGETKVVCLRSDRTGSGGWDILVPSGAEKVQEEILSMFSPIGADAVEAARLEAGIPRFGQDMNSKTLPPEMGPHFIGKHISYNKGCYVGQEVLMRMHSRGHANRSWMGLLSKTPLPVGASVSHSLRQDAGVVTSAAFSPDYGYIGAAMLRKEAAIAGDTVMVATDEGMIEAEVRQMPILRLD